MKQKNFVRKKQSAEMQYNISLSIAVNAYRRRKERDNKCDSTERCKEYNGSNDVFFN